MLRPILIATVLLAATLVSAKARNASDPLIYQLESVGPTAESQQTCAARCCYDDPICSIMKFVIDHNSGHA